ncbi:hypothetical protein [Parashewanella tropica]|uniref:hypothetical protein n=1 Tax=Parashewanella tropica TaxID=2547970 RepID=UPI00105A697D|nr:hypothetical protein [Parashewanella tropica]
MNYRIVSALLILFSAQVNANQIECGTVKDVEVLNKHDVVMLGEIHGTIEVPKLFGDIVCHSAKDGIGDIAVMLELPASLQASLDLYMIGKIDEQAFLFHPVWAPAWQDGRFSVAMMDLIKTLKLIKQKYPQKLNVFLVDLLPENSNKKPKSQYLADNISKHLSNEYDKTFVLTGNYHNRVNVKNGNSAATLLEKYDPFTLTIKSPKGSYWSCTGSKATDCKENSFNSGQDVSREGVVVFDDIQPWHGVYQLKKLTFSPPARF